MSEYIEREALRDALYEADAITMKGVAIINQFPTADVMPVVCGEWTTNSDYPDTVICSLCGWRESVWWADKGTNYCPNCGAKMEDKL